MEHVLLARDDVLPLVIVGHEVPSVGGYVSSHPLREFPALEATGLAKPIYVYSHQFGGYSCLHTNVVGIGMRLAANQRNFGRDASPLLEILRGMGETHGPPVFADPELSVLEGWHETTGDSFSEPDLRDVHEVFRTFLLGVPRFATGHEAFLETEALTDATCFDGWVTATFEHAGGAPGGSRFNFWDTEEHPIVTEGVPFDALLFAQLQRVGDALGASGGPRVFVLWENSD